MTYFHTKCGHCGSTWTTTLSSISKILCADCLKYTDWVLKPKQQSVLIDGLVGESHVKQEETKKET